MDSKQKAKELIETFTFNCKECDNAKLSALFAVDEIIKSSPSQPSDTFTMPHFIACIYWQEVKKELLKL
jgi:hypothetical protein